MNKICVIYNSCGISGLESDSTYILGIDGLLRQDLDGCRVVFSNTLGTHDTREAIRDYFGSSISHHYVNEKHPIAVTFNHAIQQVIKHIGEFEAYIYVSAGIFFTDDNQLSRLYRSFKNGPNAMVSAQVSQDDGYFSALGIGRHENDRSENYKLFEKGDYKIPVGKAVNAHCNLCSNEMFRLYRTGVSPDIFAGHCSESVSTAVCGAIKRDWIICKDVLVQHDRLWGNQSSGYLKEITAEKPRWNHGYKVDLIETLKKGIPYGLFYETIQNIIPLQPDKFDENGYALDDRLYPFIRDNLFLSKDLLDYDKIESEFIV